MRELMQRNDARARRVRQLHLHADRGSRRRVPGRRRPPPRPRPGAAALRARGAGARLAAAGDPRADPLLRRRGPPARARLPRRGPHAARRPRSAQYDQWRSSSPPRSAASPSTRPPTATRCPRTSRCWRPTSRPTRRCPRSSRRPQRALAGANRYPDPTNARLRSALTDRYGVPRQRIAIGNGSCDILLAAGEALLEPGAELVYAWPSFSVYPHLAAASGATRDRRSRSTTTTATTSTRCAAEITVADAAGHRLQPQQPDVDRARRCADIAAFVERGPAPRLRDPRRGLLRVQHCSTTPTPRSTCCDRHPNLVLLRTFSKVYGLAGCASATRCAAARSSATAVDQVRQPFFCNAAAQAAAVEALKHQDEVAARVERDRRRAHGARGRRCASWASTRADSQANFVWFDLPATDADEAEVDARASAERGVLVRAGAALGRDGRAARDLRHAGARTSASCARLRELL